MVTQLAAANCYKEDHLVREEIWNRITAAQFYYSTGYFLTVSPPSVMRIARHAAETNKVRTQGPANSASWCTAYTRRYTVHVVLACRSLRSTWLRRSSHSSSTALCSTSYRTATLSLATRPKRSPCRRPPNTAYAARLVSDVACVASRLTSESLILCPFGIVHQTNNIGEIALKIAAITKVNTNRPRVVVITQGHLPTLVVENGKLTEYPVLPIAAEEIIDTNGAGDAFVGGFLAQLVRGAPDEARHHRCG